MKIVRTIHIRGKELSNMKSVETVAEDVTLETCLITLWKSEKGYCSCNENEIKVKFNPAMARRQLEEAKVAKPPNIFMQFLASLVLRYKI